LTAHATHAPIAPDRWIGVDRFIVFDFFCFINKKISKFVYPFF